MKSSMYAGLFLAPLLVGLAAATVAADSQVSSLEMWEEFKAQHGKSYTQEEDTWRMQIFLAELEEVERFNREESEEKGFTIGINSFSDLTPGEIEQFNGYRAGGHVSHRSMSERADRFLEELLSDDQLVPEYVNWTERGDRVTSVKDQRLGLNECASCWAMATAGLLEGQLVPNNVEFQNLSVQNMMDCTDKSFTCKEGGIPKIAIEVLARDGGIMSERDYPYEARHGEICKFDESKSVIRPTEWVELPKRNETALKKVVSVYGPVLVAIGVRPRFAKIQGEVLSDERECAEELNHAVLVVGYGTDPEKGDYWLVKNSWGTSVHVGGYFRMARGRNICGIANGTLIAMF